MDKDLEVSRNSGPFSRGCSPKVEQRGFQPYVVAWESELRFMAGLAARGGNIETGGEVYGLETHAGRPVIILATTPGPNAIHEVARFRQDIDFFKKINEFLRDYVLASTAAAIIIPITT